MDPPVPVVEGGRPAPAPPLVLVPAAGAVGLGLGDAEGVGVAPPGGAGGEPTTPYGVPAAMVNVTRLLAMSRVNDVISTHLAPSNLIGTIELSSMPASL